MKKLYTTIYLLSVTIIGFAQVAAPNFVTKEEYKEEKTHVENSIIHQSSISAPPFWSSDFSNPSDWTLDNGGQPSPYGWTIDANLDSWYFNNPISSTSGGNYAELYNGDASSGTQMLNVSYKMTVASSIDVLSLAGTDNVTLSWEEYGARFNDLQEVQVSTDGQNFVTVADNLSYSVLSQSGGSVYPNPATRTVNLQPYISGNASTVWIRFSWTTNFPGSATNPNVWITYGWMIDDVSLTATPDYVMDALEANHGGWLTTPFSQGFGMQYTFKPLNQSAANPYKFELVAANHGTLVLDGAMLNVEVKDVTNNVLFSDYSDTLNLAVFDTAVFAANNTFDPAAIGLYSIDIWGSADNFSTTNVLSFDAVITDSVYGRDAGDASRGFMIARSCGAHKIGNIFDVYVTDELTSVSAHVNDVSVPGANMFIEIYEVDTTGGNLNFIFLEVSNDYEIQTADIDNWVNINFDPPINMMQGQYLVVAGGYPSPVDTFGISTSGDAETSMSRIQDNCGNLGSQPIGFWYYINNVPMIRMNFGIPWSISYSEELVDTEIGVYPNPAKDNLTVTLNALGTNMHTIRLTDVLAKTVYESSNKVSGTYVENIDVSALKKGIYFLEISNSESTVAKKIIIE